MRISTRTAIAYSLVSVGLCQLPAAGRDGPAELRLQIGTASHYECVSPDAEVAVTLRMENLPEPVSGYQAFVRFDEDALAFLSGTYVLPEPFGWVLITPIVATDGNIDMAAGIYPFTQQPTHENADLVTLRFTALAGAAPTRVFFRDSVPPTVLTLPSGSPLVPALFHSPWIVISDDPFDPCGCFHPDLNGDGTVDIADYPALEACLTGPEPASLPGSCACADFDEDGDVDLADVAWFQQFFASPAPALPTND